MATFSICGTIGANTGGIDCDVMRGLPMQLVVGSGSFIPDDYATMATFQTKFLEKIRLASGSSQKLFPFPVIQGNTPRTTEARFGTLGYGTEVKLLRSKPGYEFNVIAGSDLEKKLMQFDGVQIPVFIFDDKNRIWGVRDSAGNFKGAVYLIGVEPKDFEDSNDVKTTRITISIVDSRDFVENAAYADTEFNTSDLQGLMDVEMYEATANTTNVYKIGLRIPTSNLTNPYINVYDTYADEMADGTLWSAAVGAGFGTPLPITSVAKDATNKCWTVTFDGTDFGNLSGGDKIKVTIGGPAALAAKDVLGIEVMDSLIVEA